MVLIILLAIGFAHKDHSNFNGLSSLIPSKFKGFIVNDEGTNIYRTGALYRQLNRINLLSVESLFRKKLFRSKFDALSFKFPHSM